MPSTRSNDLRDATLRLSAADPVLAALIRSHGPCALWTGEQRSLFHHLASAIIAQQISVQAADTIQRRVMKLVSNPLTPRKYLAARPEALRSAGLSRSKAAYIGNVAEAVVNGLSKNKLRALSDEDAIAALSAIKGVGRWTAEMYLMFGLRRLDVLSLGDAGLQRAARDLYNRGEERDGLLERVSESWRPYRTVACWYLWKSTDAEPL